MALYFKEEIVSSLNTPLSSINDGSKMVDGGTNRAGAATVHCGGEPSQGADSYGTTVGEGLGRERIEGMAYVLT